ncbi:MAG TPA: N-acetylmuramoyl-L-alanine amidase-like domain-containing protein [Chthoniobacterales bacterium]|nr:N-acetylmuramoyl-L-alanine amidase-like domain-containing protein [Chthoniobacterales bacterium]
MSAFLIALLLFSAGLTSAGSLPLSAVFRGQSRFYALVAEAERQNWRALPLGERIVAVGKSLLGVRYVNYTLEIDDHVEAPSVNMEGLDCWTFFEVSVGFARMLEMKSGNYTPNDLLAMIELDRYRGGRCDGSYTSRLHFLEDWIYDNERRGLVKNLTVSLRGVPMRGRYLNEMSHHWRESRYLRHNVALVPQIAAIEQRIASRTIYHIPREQVSQIESKIRNGDVICITGRGPEGFTEHVGLAYRDGVGVVHFMHASKDERRVVIDVPIHQYVYRYHKFAGIMVVRPLDVTSPSSRLAEN